MFTSVTNHTLWGLKSLFSLKKENLQSTQEVVLDFKSFYSLMKLDDLNLSESDKNHVKVLYDNIKADQEDHYHSWEAMIAWIDLKVTEKNYQAFEYALDLSSRNLNEDVCQHIKRLYFLTDHYALSGRLLEAKETWKILMALMKHELQNFEEQPLKSFNGGILNFS